MSIADSYDKVIESIRSEREMNFNMNSVFQPEGPDSLYEEDVPNFCGSGGCIVGHTTLAVLPEKQAWNWLMGFEGPDPDELVCKYLNMTSTAMNTLCYNNYEAKDNKDLTIDILLGLKGIAVEHKVYREDVETVERHCFKKHNEKREEAL